MGEGEELPCHDLHDQKGHSEQAKSFPAEFVRQNRVEEVPSLSGWLCHLGAARIDSEQSHLSLPQYFRQ